jgi:PGF-pre-PGF domain-containing protein
MKLENENATDPWSLEFMNMTAAGTVNTNKTTLESDELIANTTDDGISYVGMDHDAWADLKYELNPKEVKICVPGDVDTLYYCANESAVSVDECLNVTGQVTSGPTYNSGLDCTEFTVPADLGFSVYFGKSGGGDGGSSSSSSGSGGGGAGGGGATSRYIATASWAGMQKGIRTMSISSKYIPFTKLEIDVKAPVTGEASITVKMLNESEKPTVELLPGKVHSYLKITTTKITDENINNVKIKFKLPQSWFDKNSLGLDNIALYRYAGKWAPLPTKRIDYINETAYYEATTPGFSYFGIAEKQAVKQEEPEQPLVTTDEGTEQETPSPEQQPGTEEAKERAKQNILPPVLYAIIAVVLVGGIIFLISRKKQRSSK